MGVGADAGGLSGWPGATAYRATNPHDFSQIRHKRSHTNADRRCSDAHAHSYVAPGPYNRDCNRRAITRSDPNVTRNTDAYAFRSDVGASAAHRRSNPG